MFRKENQVVTFTGWDNFVENAEKLMKEGPHGNWIYQGQADSSWGLEPSLLRIIKGKISDVEKAIYFETRLSHYFIGYGNKYYSKMGKKSRQLISCQHGNSCNIMVHLAGC